MRRRYRAFAIARALRDGMSVDAIHELTKIDRWFLSALAPVVDMHESLKEEGLSARRGRVEGSKELGFCDSQIGLSDKHTRRNRPRAAPGKRHRAAPGADRHARRRVSRRNELPLHELPREARRRRAVTAPEDHGARVGRVPHRLFRRVRLVLRERDPGGVGARVSRQSCSTTTPRPSAPTTTCATS